MRKVFLVVSLSFFAGFVLIGCAKKYTIDQYQVDMESVRDDDSALLWNEAQDDEFADHVAVLTKIIKDLEHTVEQVKDIEKKITDDEMKKAHVAYIRGYELRRDGFKKILEGVNNQDYDAASEGEQMLQDSAAPRAEWMKFIEKMAKAMDKQ